MIALEEGRLTEARAAFDTGLDIARQIRLRREETVLLCSLAELHLRQGDFEAAINCATEAHALAANFDIISSAEAAAVVALWAALLAGKTDVASAWHDVVAAITEPLQPEVRGRLALARAMLALHQPAPDREHLADLLAEATAYEASLSEEERAYAALLRAELAFSRTGWHGAAEAWHAFAARANTLSNPILHRFASIHCALF